MLRPDNPHKPIGAQPWRCWELQNASFYGRGRDGLCGADEPIHCWHDTHPIMCCGCGQFRDPLLEAMRKASR